MMFKKTTIALLATAALGSFALPAFAQEAAPAEAAPAVEDQASEIEFLKAQLESMQAQIADLQKTAKNTAPTFKGSPLFEDKESGWSFKVRGRYMQDAAFISNPNDAIAGKNLGFNTKVRRVRLGVEGSMPGDFGYKFEADFANAGANSNIGFGDVILSWNPSKGPITINIGNHETFESLEQISSSRFVSFIERAQMNDAFNHTRRLGMSVNFADKANVLRFGAGIFSNHSIDQSFDNDGWIGAARLTYSPDALGGKLHFGANYQHREFQSNAQNIQYRARPFLQTTDVRFVSTGTYASKGDDIFGLELAGIFGPLHGAAEAQLVKSNAYGPGDLVNTNGDLTGSTTVPGDDPEFFSWYAELGYFLTGETRGYKNGAWDRTKVLNPVNKGGMGAFQINARYDYLDLTDGKLQNGFTNNFSTGVSTVSTSLSRGGKQTGYLLGLTWIPMDYVRFLVNYIHSDVEGGPFAAAVKPTSTKPVDKRSYGVDAVAVRAQFDF